MKNSLPKQFHVFLEKPLLYYSLKAFNVFSKKIKILLVLPSAHLKNWKILCNKYSIDIKHTVVEGGETRFQSVKNALLTLENNRGIVAIHDAIRPLISGSLIKRCYTTASIKKSAIPVIPIESSILKVHKNINVSLDRNKFKLVQTPQCFKLDVLQKAYLQEYQNSFTDDASVFEASGEKIYTVKGEITNIKITYPTDAVIAEVLYKNLYS